jgi:predicted transcriptional regulator
MHATVKQIAEILSTKRLSAVTVSGPEGETIGIVSNMDILKTIGKENWGDMKAEDIMSTYLESVEPTCHLKEAAIIMREKHIHRLIVFSERGVGASQRPIGILSISDIVREAAHA